MFTGLFEEFMPFKNKVWLSSPTMHGEESRYVEEAFLTNWVSTAGRNIDLLEKGIAQYVGAEHAVALSSGTAALHMCVKLAGQRINPDAKPGNSLFGKKVFCSDLTFAASVNPVIYEGGTPVFIDTDPNTWNMDPQALENAFALYPDVHIVILVHLYGVPGNLDDIIQICKKHHALLIEDAAEALGASYHGENSVGKCGSFGDYIALSFNGNKIITGSSGGMFLTNNVKDAEQVRKWSTQSREKAPWYQHCELGYNYRMSNIVAGIARGNLRYIEEHIKQKTDIYLRYKEGLKSVPVTLNPHSAEAEPNYWLSCALIDSDAMCYQERSGQEYKYTREHNKSCPMEILDALSRMNAEGRPIWKPMHMQPIYSAYDFVKRKDTDVGADIFHRGLCLPSDNKMSIEQQDIIIEIIKRCFA